MTFSNRAGNRLSGCSLASFDGRIATSLPVEEGNHDSPETPKSCNVDYFTTAKSIKPSPVYACSRETDSIADAPKQDCNDCSVCLAGFQIEFSAEDVN